MNNYKFYPSNDRRGYKITIMVGSPNSWIIPWALLVNDIISPFHKVVLCFDSKKIQKSDITFLLSCTQILPNHILKKSKINLVIHESDLPLGRGWSPMAYQISYGVNNIPVVLFEATENIDSGSIYLKDFINLNGTELLPEIREKQGIKTVEMLLKFLTLWPNLQPKEQIGAPTYYKKRTVDDDKLDIYKTIADNFDHLRIVDNENYPAWFEYRGKKYTIKVFPKDLE